MKTRIIQTRFWDDDAVESVSKDAQHLWIYLLTCQYINMSGIFKLKDIFIQDQTKLTASELEKAKVELQKTGKIYFYNGWVYVVNAEEQNKYRNSPQNEVAYSKELAQIPDKIKSYFKGVTKANDTTIDTSLETSHKSEIINHKSKIYRKNRKNYKKLMGLFNENYSTNYQATNNRFIKYKARLKTYTHEKLVEALEIMSQTPFYNGANDRGWVANPDYFLRSDEIIDRLLNKSNGNKKPSNHANESTDRFKKF